ncbi:carboxypeptidase-like regulatory domain-containing protein [Pedobacter sp. SYP-B3415]|uniref:alpha-2-macroglobulin family protein n=1 Tax=Pedobacter sp. SYP-B3415 TaxID=2496641 RepID=UPI00101DE3F5|nr:carboxypeptidase-like regulatory domain-containing protein [Pedobacter sp. SYP-B3415]
MPKLSFNVSARTSLIYIVFILLLVIGSASGQKLSSSLTSSSLTRVYKLTDAETFLFATGKRSSSFFHNQVDSFQINRPYQAKLSPGHYLFVTARHNKLDYRLHAVQNLDIFFVNQSGKPAFILTDPQGKPVSHALVRIGQRRTVGFDEKQQLYVARRMLKQAVIQAEYEGQSNFFVLAQEERDYSPGFFRKIIYGKPLRYVWQPVKNIFNGRHRRKVRFEASKPAFTGYMTFSKPRYKPVDTLRWKALVVTTKGRSIQATAAELVLKRPGEADQVVDTVQPVRAGSYSGQFPLAKLKLQLDQQYTLELRKPGSASAMVSKYFAYEDYELGSLQFAVRTDKTEQSPGNPAAIYMKAIDDNGLAVPDGRVEVVVTSGAVKVYGASEVFVRDTLWKKKINLEPVGETKLVIPDNVFPQADLSFRVSFEFRNSNNESRREERNLTYKYGAEQIVGRFERDSIAFYYYKHGKSHRAPAVLYRSLPDGSYADSLAVSLPYKSGFDPRFAGFEIKAGKLWAEIDVEDFEPDVSFVATQTADSLRVQLNNPRQIPVWYTVYSGNGSLFKGYAQKLDTTIRFSGRKTVHVRGSFRWGEDEKHVEQMTQYNKNLLDVKLDAPEVIFPGQSVNMRVAVRDAANRPVSHADLTAQAYTTKFDQHTVIMPYFRDRRYTALKARSFFEGENIDLTSGQLPLEWPRWAKRLAIDTVEYYKFMYPTARYELAERSADSTTSVLPFLVRNGAIEPVSIVYVDGVPVFFSQSDQFQRYAFKIGPGRHRIILRSSTFEADFVTDIRPGHRHVISILADPSNKDARVVVQPAKLHQAEQFELSKYMLRVDDNFESEKTVIKDDDGNKMLLSMPRRDEKNLLIGPIAANYLTFSRPSLTMPFLKEAGFSYTFSPGLIRQKSAPLFENPDWVLRPDAAWGNTDYRQHVLQPQELDSIWNDYLDLRSRTTQLFPAGSRSPLESTPLTIELDTALTAGRPFLKTVVVYKHDEPDFVRILPGISGLSGRFAAGLYRVLFLLKDNSYYLVKRVLVKAGGSNYFLFSKLDLHKPDLMSLGIDSLLKIPNTIRNAADNGNRTPVPVRIAEQFNDQHFNRADFPFRITGVVTDALNHAALPGVAVKVKGFSAGVLTRMDGSFTIAVPEKGRLVFSSLGYESEEISIRPGSHLGVELRAAQLALDEVVVVGYGAQYKRNLTSAVSTLSGKLAGIQIRGSAAPHSKEPLLIVDGIPYNGKVADIAADDIADMSVLRDAEATGIYGAMAANGVVIIKTKHSSIILPAGGGPGSGLRRNFSDMGFFKPDLLTDGDGVARFKVTFPDDITSWNTQIMAMTGRRQTGQLQTTIRSFKALSSNFVSPQFAIAGDSMQVMGKVMNYTPKEERGLRKFAVGDKEELSGEIRIKNAHLDSMMVLIEGTDSLRFRYTLEQANGYLDGEDRKIPVYAAGVTETAGNFAALQSDTVVNWSFDANKGPVRWRAEASVFPVLLAEMERIRNYPYFCNEQLASKLKSLLLEKQLRKLLGEPFTFERDIEKIITLLEKNRLRQGTWSWWPNGVHSMWITLHAAEAFLLAEEQGYKTKLDRKLLFSTLTGELTRLPAGERMHLFELLHKLDPHYTLKDWLKREESALKGLKDVSTSARLRLMRFKQLGGERISAESLLSAKKNTMFGGIYWGNAGHHFFDNSIQNTLLVYKMLKLQGGREAELQKIRQYFLEQRRDGAWRNTYESVLILETILPDLVGASGARKPSKLEVNGKLFGEFPAMGTVLPADQLKVAKTGGLPVYLTAYQQAMNPRPARVEKDFEVRTALCQNGLPVNQLRAGEAATLRVSVSARADADYVMIEVPVPAGCSYMDKTIDYSKETHREYFKEKTAIFCSKLKQGDHTFEIRIMPRYQGRYVLNPAKAEMMYFPVFYGREGIKSVRIQ